MVVEVAATLLAPKKEMVPDLPFFHFFCRVTRRSGEILGSHRQLICSIGDVFGGCTRFCVLSRVFNFLRIFAEFLRKFARKVHEEAHRLGLRFFFYTIAKVFRRFQVARDSLSLLNPRKRRSRFSKFRIFALIVLLRLEANFEFQNSGSRNRA